jgi:hypothetical protein
MESDSDDSIAGELLEPDVALAPCGLDSCNFATPGSVRKAVNIISDSIDRLRRYDGPRASVVKRNMIDAAFRNWVVTTVFSGLGTVECGSRWIHDDTLRTFLPQDV